MYAVRLEGDIPQDKYQMAVGLLKVIGLEVERNEDKDVFKLTNDDLIAIAKSDEDIKENRVKTASEVQKKARELCMM